MNSFVTSLGSGYTFLLDVLHGKVNINDREVYQRIIALISVDLVNNVIPEDLLMALPRQCFRYDTCIFAIRIGLNVLNLFCNFSS